MSQTKTYVVLGLGRFGSTLAKELTDANQDVIAIDIKMANVEKISSYVANALCLDYTDIDALKSAGIKDADIGIVTTGSMLDQEIQGIINLKELGVPYVVAKARSLKMRDVLLKVGADETVSPLLNLLCNSLVCLSLSSDSLVCFSTIFAIVASSFLAFLIFSFSFANFANRRYRFFA